MPFRKICSLDDLWEGEMKAFEVDGEDVLLVYPADGDVVAIQTECPHQGVPLSEGEFDGSVLVCRAHQWEFDPASGEGVNPTDCRLKRYRTMVEDDSILVNQEDE